MFVVLVLPPVLYERECGKKAKKKYNQPRPPVEPKPQKI